MNSIESFLLRAFIGVVFILVNIVSIYLLLRGHNLPGGGFIGGLMTGMSFILLGLVRGWLQLQEELPFPPLRMAALGLLIAICSGCAPMLVGEPFMTQHNFHLQEVPLLGTLHIGTPLLFDFGIFLLVGGVTVKLVIVLARSTSGMTAFTKGEALYYASTLERPIEHEFQDETPLEKEAPRAD